MCNSQLLFTKLLVPPICNQLLSHPVWLKLKWKKFIDTTLLVNLCLYIWIDLSELVGLGLFVFPQVNTDAVFTNYIICLVFNSRHVVNRPQHTISQPPNLPVPILDEEGTSPKYDHGDVIGVFTSSTIVIGTSLRMAALCIGRCVFAQLLTIHVKCVHSNIPHRLDLHSPANWPMTAQIETVCNKHGNLLLVYATSHV